jgi:hypothetical protein
MREVLKGFWDGLKSSGVLLLPYFSLIPQHHTSPSIHPNLSSGKPTQGGLEVSVDASEEVLSLMTAYIHSGLLPPLCPSLPLLSLDTLLPGNSTTNMHISTAMNNLRIT